MLILLPPSEGKSTPGRGKPLDLATLSFPSLQPARAKVLDTLVDLCRRTPEQAAGVLDLGPTQAAQVAGNATLTSAATARADRVYQGVLYEALDLASLEPPARRRASSRLAIVSGLFGLLRPSDHIPAYRLSGQVILPGVGPVSRFWGHHLGPAVEEASRGGLVVDLRSSAYLPFWRPPRDLASSVVRVRVLHEAGGRRKVVSHFNKATKGRLVRDVLRDGTTARSPRRLVEQLRDLGWQVETPDGSQPGQLDVVVAEL